MCAGNAAFCHTLVVSESKIVCEMTYFIKETVVRLCQGRRYETVVAAVLAFVRLCSLIA